MRLTIQTDYALRMLMFLAVQGECRSSIREISTAYGISENHLMKITQRLAAAGYIDARRGRSGGLRLGREAASISVGEVVREVEPDFALVECLGDSNQCPLTPACVLKRALKEARKAFLAVLDQYTVAALVAQPQRLRTALAIRI